MRVLIDLIKIPANQLAGIIKRILEIKVSEWVVTKIEFFETLDNWWLVTFNAKNIEYQDSVTCCNRTNFEIQFYGISYTKIEFYEILDMAEVE